MPTEIRRLGALAREVEVDVLESCPWCSSTSIAHMATRGDGLPVMRCSSCHLGFLGEVPIDLAVFYDDEYFKRSEAPGDQPAFAGYEDYNRSYSPSSFRWLAMLIRSITGPDAKTIFDLGAATGTFLEAATIEGFEAYGSELNPIAAHQALERGASVKAGPFTPSDWAGSRFDVVTALEVLEHVKDVRDTLSGLAELVSRDGLIVFFVPNVDDYLVERYGDSALDFQKSYDHTLYFNPRFLYSMCEELFGPDSLTLLTHEAEEWGQTVSAALGFIRLDGTSSRPEREFVAMLSDGSEGPRVTELSSYDALALALTAAKFSEATLADIALDRAMAEGADPVQLSTAKAQIHRHRGELIRAVAELEEALVGEGLTGDPIGVAVLMDCLGDLAMLMGARGGDLATSMGELLERFDSFRGQQEALTRMEELLRSTLAELRDTRDERRLREEAIQSELNDLRSRNNELTGEVAKLSEARVHLQEEARSAVELRGENSKLRSQLNEIYESRAWRLVSGVRSAKSLPRRLLSSSETVTDSPTGTGFLPIRTPLEALEALPFRVSVIMPVYNKGHTIRETIDSVLAQTVGDVEIVVWNDGSTDENTLRTLDEISGLPGIQVFHAENRGVVAARNSAMSLARGRYFCCLDPDDIIDPTYLEKACAILQSGSGFAIAYPYVHSFGDVDERWETQDLDPALILKANHVPVCAVFDRRVFDLTGGFSDAMADGYEDWEFWAHAAELGFKGRAIPEHLFHYRYSRSHQESRDAIARQRDSDLRERIGALHPHLARTGRPLDSVPLPDLSFGELTIGQRKYPTGSGNPIVVTLPWFTIGGADTVVEMAVRRWVEAGRTVVVITTHEVGAGMTSRIEELRTVTPFVYQLPAMLPEHLWGDFVNGVVSSLDSPTLWNVGSAWLYGHLSELRAKFPDLTVVDQQFNEIGHMDSNRKAAEFIDLTIAAYAQLAEKLESDGRTTSVKPIYVGIEDVGRPSATAVSQFRDELGVTEDQNLVLYVGRLSEEKRPEWMVELANRLEPAEAKVAVIGNGPLREVISKAASDNPELIWVEKTESVMEAISSADVIALPSRTEGIPLVALEALAAGTPIVATAVGGLPDLEGINGVTLTDPADFEDFLAGIRAALERPSSDVTLPAEFRSESMLEELDEVLFGYSRNRAEELSG